MNRTILGVLILVAILAAVLMVAGCVDRPLTQSEKEIVRLSTDTSRIW